MGALDPVIQSALIAVLVLVAVAAAIWMSLAGRVTASEAYTRRLKTHAPPMGYSQRQSSTEEEVRRQLNLIKARRRRSGTLSYNLALQQAGLNWPDWVAPLVVLGLIGALLFPVLFYRSSRSWWLMLYFMALPHELPINGGKGRGEHR